MVWCKLRRSFNSTPLLFLQLFLLLGRIITCLSQFLQDNTDGMIRQCQLCEDIHLATFHCMDCDEDMCEIMKIGHSKAKVSKHHTIIPIPELKSVITSPSKESSCNVCPIHNDSYRYYDEICQTRICRDCFALTHYGHRCVSIEEGFLEKKKLMDLFYMVHLHIIV